MRIILSSFRQAEFYSGPKFSVARWQPIKNQYPEIKFLAPFGLEHLPPERYRNMYCRQLAIHRAEFLGWLNSLTEPQASLLCWCNPDRQKSYPQLMCHTILIGYEIESLFHLGFFNPDSLQTVYADGRDKPVWSRDID